MQNLFAASSLELTGSESSQADNQFSVSDFSGSKAGLKPIFHPLVHQKIYDVQGELEGQIVYDVKKRGATGSQYRY